MSDETKPSHDLITLRDHAHRMAIWQPGKPALFCQAIDGRFGYSRNPQHGSCRNPSCGCACHQPTDTDRVLWQRIAAEIDAYINGDLSSQDGLF